MQLRLPLLLFVGIVWLTAASDARAQTTAYREAPQPAPQPLVPPAASASPASSRSPLDVGASMDFGGYADSDHVFVMTPLVAGRLSNPTAGWSVDGSYLVDVVSAASVDIVSTASQPYHEIRQAGTLNASYQPRNLGGAVSSSISREPDYLSVRAGGSVTDELFDKNLTLFFGYDYGHDIAGRTSTPFSVFSNVLDSNALKAGITFVLDRRTIASVVADGVLESGDQSKPYRYVPLFAPGTHVPVGAPVSLVTSLRLSERALEQLPLSRDRYALSFRVAHRFGHSSTLRLDERVYDDTWSLLANTTDARYLIDIGPIFEVGPHVRLNTQSPVSFWQRAYTMGQGLSFPEYRTGDRELGPLIGGTLGFSTRWKLGPAGDRLKWVLGWDVNVTETHYFDDLYITNRFSAVSSVSIEAAL